MAGASPCAPTRSTFNYHQIVNIYQDDNAYFVDHGWMRVDRPNRRRPDGNIVSMMKDENHYELTVGDKSRSGGQWDIWEATYARPASTAIRNGSGTRKRARSIRRSLRNGSGSTCSRS